MSRQQVIKYLIAALIAATITAATASSEGGGENPSFAVTLNTPAPNTFNLSAYRLLNASISDPENQTFEAWIYAGDSSTDATRLVYHNFTLLNNTNILYNLTTLPVSAANDPNIVLLMHMDNDSAYGENDTFMYDSSIYKNNGTVQGNATPTLNGKYSGAYSFNGGYINVSNPNSLNITKQITMSAWFKTSVVHNGAIIWKGDITFSPAYGMTYFGSDYSAIYVRIINNTGGLSGGGLEYVADNIWHNIAATYNGSTIWVYFDGQHVDTTPMSGDIVTTDYSVLIGYRETHNDLYFNGSIDEVAIWNRSLNSSEIEDLYRLKNGSYWWYANISNGTISISSESRKFTVGVAAANNAPVFGYRILQPTGGTGTDTYISNTTGGPYGGDQKLQTGTWGGSLSRSLLYFNTSAIPSNANLTSASMSLYLYGGSYSTQESVVNLTDSWDKQYADWTHRTQSLLWGTPGGD